MRVKSHKVAPRKAVLFIILLSALVLWRIVWRESSVERRINVDSSIETTTTTASSRKDVLPHLFAGISEGKPRPEKGISMEKLKLCQASKGGPLEESNLATCDDPTCLSCISEESLDQVEPLLKGFWDETMKARRKRLYESWFPKGSGTVHLIAIDKQQMQTLLNWVCSMEKIVANPAAMLLVVVAQQEEFQLLSNVGLKVLDPSLSIPEGSRFPQKQRGFKFGMSNLIRAGAELVEFGYDVIMQDSDVVWRRNILSELETSKEFLNLDIMTQAETRFDAQGPANTGFVYVRSNEKTKLFMHTMVNHLALVYHMQDDQRLWNHMLRHHFFLQLHFELIPTTLVRGLFSSWDKARLARTDPAIIHRVGNQDRYAVKKCLDLKSLGMWNFDETCRTVKPSDFPKATFPREVERIWSVH